MRGRERVDLEERGGNKERVVFNLEKRLLMNDEEEIQMLKIGRICFEWNGYGDGIHCICKLVNYQLQ